MDEVLNRNFESSDSERFDLAGGYTFFSNMAIETSTCACSEINYKFTIIK